MMQRNPSASDYIALHKFKNSKFRNVHEEAVIWLRDPNRGWAGNANCVGWPCTAPNNVVLQFE